MTEPELIAQRLAGSPWFRLAVSGGPVAVRDSVAHVEVDGNVVSVTVTDHDGSKREYQAQVVMVSTAGAPAECKHCTVPTSDGTDVCTFCRNYEPPRAPRELLED